MHPFPPQPQTFPDRHRRQPADDGHGPRRHVKRCRTRRSGTGRSNTRSGRTAGSTADRRRRRGRSRLGRESQYCISIFFVAKRNALDGPFQNRLLVHHRRLRSEHCRCRPIRRTQVRFLPDAHRRRRLYSSSQRLPLIVLRVVCVQRHDSKTDRPQRHFRAVIHAELLVNAADMVFHRVRTDK